MFGSKGDDQGQFNNPYGIVVDEKNQHIIVSDEGNHRLQSFSRQGQYLSSYGSKGSGNGQFNYPRQLCIHPLSNHIIVADWYNHRLQMLTDQFQFVKVIGQGQLQYPRAVDCSRSTHHIVTADCNRQLHLYSSDGNTLIRSYTARNFLLLSASRTTTH